jgi:hypothetical protein
MVGLPYLIRGGLLLAIGLLAVVTDVVTERTRSWTHWAGIILWLLGQIGSLLMGFYFLYLWDIS